MDFLNVTQWEKHQRRLLSKPCRSRKSGNPRLVLEITSTHIRLPVWQPTKHNDSRVILWQWWARPQCLTVSVWQTDREHGERQTVWLAEINQQDIRIKSFHRFKSHSELFNCAWHWAFQYIKRHGYAFETGCIGTLHPLALFVQLTQEKRSCWTKSMNLICLHYKWIWMRAFCVVLFLSVGFPLCCLLWADE